MKFCFISFLLAPFAVIAADTNEPAALIPAYGELQPTFWELHQIPIIVGVCAVLALAFLFFRVWLRPRPPVILPPDVVACEALAALQGRPEDGKLLSEVSQILRRYVLAAFGLPAVEMTTAEFGNAMAAQEKIGAELALSISEFLRECDERKFSPAAIAPAFDGVACARELISRCETRRRRSAPDPGAAMGRNPADINQPHAVQGSDIAASEDGRTPR
jgi:hypothetical protein